MLLHNEHALCSPSWFAHNLPGVRFIEDITDKFIFKTIGVIKNACIIIILKLYIGDYFL